MGKSGKTPVSSFDDLLRKLVQVPKAEVEALEAKKKKERAKARKVKARKK